MFDDHLKHKDEFEKKYKLGRLKFFYLSMRLILKSMMKSKPIRLAMCMGLCGMTILPIGIALEAIRINPKFSVLLQFVFLIPLNSILGKWAEKLDD